MGATNSRIYIKPRVISGVKSKPFVTTFDAALGPAEKRERGINTTRKKEEVSFIFYRSTTIKV